MTSDVSPGEIIKGFNYETPVAADIMRRHIAENIGRDLPDVLIRRRAHVLANGPSLASYFDNPDPSNVTVAVNGALGYCLERGLIPDYWLACDPQAKVADFLPDNPPLATTYLVASKCHPSVFEKLDGRYVQLWHLSDQEAEGRLRVPCSCTVTASAPWLLWRMGFTDQEYWGWDGCFVDGQHHAGAGETNGERLTVNVGGTVGEDGVIGGRNYETTRSWAAEAQSAQQVFLLAKYFDLSITVHGDGLIKAMQEII